MTGSTIVTESEPLLSFDTAAVDLGRELHSQVAPELWNVTLLDLDNFADHAREMHRAGLLPASDNEEKNGPNMEVVNELVVIPETSRAGGMSWALMLRPEGHALGAFVSHSFSEGVYEFHRKVRGTLPGGVASFWCRLLSLPQAWAAAELADMLGQQPHTDSPFAKAIAECTNFLVVANEHESIFCRSWCVLEASIAFEQGRMLEPAPDRFSGNRRTSIGSASEARARVSTGMPQAVAQLFAGFESVRNASCKEYAIELRIQEAIKDREDQLDSDIRNAMMQLL